MLYVLAGLLLCLLPLTAAALLQRGHRRTFHERVVHGPLTITSEWVEVTPDPPLRPERVKQMLVLGLAEPYFSGYTDSGIRVPSGELVMPQVELIDAEGRTYSLSFGGSFGTTKPFFRHGALPKDVELKKIRLRCDQKVELKMLAWTTYDPKDLP